jgi:hypothetical protein
MRLGVLGLDERQVRHAVRDQIYEASQGAVVTLQAIDRSLAHHNDLRTGGEQHVHRLSLAVGRRGAHGMEGRHQRRVQRADEVQHVGAAGPAENSELVLEINQLGSRVVQTPCRLTIRTARIRLKPDSHLTGINLGGREVVDRNHIDPTWRQVQGHRVMEITGEGCNTTAARWVAANKRNLSNDGSWRHWAPYCRALQPSGPLD